MNVSHHWPVPLVKAIEEIRIYRWVYGYMEF